MPSLTLKNIPEALYDCLKEAAEQHHRSMNSEMIACLEKAYRPKRWLPDEHIAAARHLRSQVGPETISAEEIQEAINRGRC